MASALTIPYYTIMLAGGNWVTNMHGSLNCYYSTKSSWSCIITPYKHHDYIHDQSGVVQTIADALSFNKDKPDYIWGKRCLCLNRVVRTLQLGKEMSSEEMQEAYKTANVMEKIGRAWLFIISYNTVLMTPNSYPAVGLK